MGDFSQAKKESSKLVMYILLRKKISTDKDYEQGKVGRAVTVLLKSLVMLLSTAIKTNRMSH